jgi:DNA polymerase delta subunit 1
MKRGGQQGSSNPANGGAKKPRGFEEDGPSFEDELGMMEQMEYEVIDGADGPETVESQEARWARPTRAQKLDPSVDSLPFQWLDLDMTSGDPMHANPDGKQVIGSLEGPVPIVRMYGVTADGQSVMANVHGFTPYFYVSFPASVELSNALLGQLRASLDQRCRDKARGEEKNLSKFVLGVEKTEPMQSLLGYHFDQVKEFVKVSPDIVAEH